MLIFCVASGIRRICLQQDETALDSMVALNRTFPRRAL
jgi:hypothetical protein